MSDSANAVPCCRCGLPVASGIIIDDGTSYHIDCACGPDANLQIENTRLRSLLEDLVIAVEPFKLGLEYIDKIGPSMRGEYFASISVTGKFGESDLRALVEAYLKAKDVRERKDD